MFKRNPLRRLIFLGVVVFFGLLSRHHPSGLFIWDKSLGDACYAAAVFLVLAIVLPTRVGAIAVVAMLVCLAIETFKLTGLPAQWAGNPVLRVVFGTTFSFHNIVCYLAGIAVMWAIERALASHRS
jgi:hypothetical protein